MILSVVSTINNFKKKIVLSFFSFQLQLDAKLIIVYRLILIFISYYKQIDIKPILKGVYLFFVYEMFLYKKLKIWRRRYCDTL